MSAVDDKQQLSVAKKPTHRRPMTSTFPNSNMPDSLLYHTPSKRNSSKNDMYYNSSQMEMDNSKGGFEGGTFNNEDDKVDQLKVYGSSNHNFDDFENYGSEDFNFDNSSNDGAFTKNGESQQQYFDGPEFIDRLNSQHLNQQNITYIQDYHQRPLYEQGSFDNHIPPIISAANPVQHMPRDYDMYKMQSISIKSKKVQKQELRTDYDSSFMSSKINRVLNNIHESPTPGQLQQWQANLRYHQPTQPIREIDYYPEESEVDQTIDMNTTKRDVSKFSKRFSSRVQQTPMDLTGFGQRSFGMLFDNRNETQGVITQYDTRTPNRSRQKKMRDSSRNLNCDNITDDEDLEKRQKLQVTGKSRTTGQTLQSSSHQHDQNGQSIQRVIQETDRKIILKQYQLTNSKSDHFTSSNAGFHLKKRTVSEIPPDISQKRIRSGYRNGGLHENIPLNRKSKDSVRASIKEKLNQVQGFTFAKKFYLGSTQEIKSDKFNDDPFNIKMSGIRLPKDNDRSNVQDQSDLQIQELFNKTSIRPVKAFKQALTADSSRNLKIIKEEQNSQQQSQTQMNAQAAKTLNSEQSSTTKRATLLEEDLESVIQKAQKAGDRHKWLRDYLIKNEIPCEKYHYTVDKHAIGQFDHFKAVLRLSPDGKQLLIFNYYPTINPHYLENLNKRMKMEQEGLDVGTGGGHTVQCSSESGSHSDSGSAGPPPGGSQNAQNNQEKKQCTKEERIMYKRKKS